MSLKSEFKPRLPSGGALDWDMTLLTDSQLEHEYHLAYESLHGHTYQGVVILKGLRDPEYVPLFNCSEEILNQAKQVWNLRFSRAEDELERRFLLS